MKFALTLLGVSGATPAHGRFPTSQYLQIHNDHFLIDCGEGAQIRMSEFEVPRQKINQIFISHLHGDHMFGLPGFLFSLALNDRSKPLHIYSPKGLEEKLSVFLPENGGMPFPIHFHILDTDSPKLIFENEFLTVKSIPLKHRIPTCGFVFQEKESKRNIRKESISVFNLSIEQIKAIKKGEDLNLNDGKVIPNHMLTHPKWKQRSFAFISDSIFDPSIVPYINDCDLLYHETTFLDDFSENAKKTMHSTAKQAAEIASLANVGKLVTGHYSQRYKELGGFLEEAKTIFENTILGEGGKEIEVERVRMKNPD